MSTKSIVLSIFLVLFLLIFINLEAISQVSNLKKNEKVELMETSEEYDGYLYYFVSFPSCQGCLETMLSIVELSKHLGKYDTRIFISGISKDYLAKFKEENNINYDITLDNIGAYYNYFKMSKTNSLLIFSNNSEFLDAFNFAENIEFAKIEKLLKSLSKKVAKTQIKPSKLIQFKKNDEHLTLAEGLIGLYSVKHNSFYFTQVNEGLIYTADSIGNIQSEFDIKKPFNLSKFTILNFSWRIIDSIIIVQGYRTDSFEFENFILEYNPALNTYKKIDFGKELMTEFIEIKGNPTNQGYVLSRISFDMNNNNELLIFYNSQGDSISSSNVIDEIYNKFNLSKSYRQILGFSNNQIYTVQLFAKNFHLYDKNGSQLKNMRFEQSKNLRETNMDLPKIQSKSDWVDFSNKNSYYQYIKIDPNINDILLAYFNFEVPVGIDDLESPSVKKKWYYDIFNKDGKLLNSFEITDRSPWLAYFDNTQFIYFHTNNNIASAKVHYLK